MKKTTQQTVYYIPTLVSPNGTRHIIPGKDSAAYCGATGDQERPRDWRTTDLCQRCLQKFVKAVVLEERLTKFGL